MVAQGNATTNNTLLTEEEPAVAPVTENEIINQKSVTNVNIMGNHGKNIEEIKANEETNQLHGDWLVVKRKSSNKSTKNHGK